MYFKVLRFLKGYSASDSVLIHSRYSLNVGCFYCLLRILNSSSHAHRIFSLDFSFSANIKIPIFSHLELDLFSRTPSSNLILASTHPSNFLEALLDSGLVVCPKIPLLHFILTEITKTKICRALLVASI